MVEDDVLEVGGEVDLGGLDPGEVPEGVGRERAGPVLHRAGEPVLLARHPAERRERLEVELHVGDRSIGEHHPAVRGAGLDRDLADPGVPSQRREAPVVAPHEGVQLLHGAVLHPDFTDLRPHRDGDSLRLESPDERGDLGRPVEIGPLLLVQGRLRQIHQGGGVHVDVVEARSDFLGDELLHLAHFTLGIGLVLLVVHLAVVALNEQREGVPLPQGRRDQHRDVLRGPLLGVRDLRPRDLQEDRARLARPGGAEDGPRRVVGHRPHVDRGDGETADLSPAPRLIQRVDRRRPGAGRLAQLPEQPAGRFALVAFGEDRAPGQLIGSRRPKPGRVPNRDGAGGEGHGPAVEVHQLPGHISHASSSSLAQAFPPWVGKGRPGGRDRQTLRQGATSLDGGSAGRRCSS